MGDRAEADEGHNAQWNTLTHKPKRSHGLDTLNYICSVNWVFWFVCIKVNLSRSGQTEPERLPVLAHVLQRHANNNGTILHKMNTGQKGFVFPVRLIKSLSFVV